MRMSRLFSQTIRETPSEADAISHQLLLRAGFIRQLSTGIFSYLPLARQSLTKIENIIRQEINRIGGQEITMPVIHPAEIWQESGRWYKIGNEMGRFKDKTGRDMVLSMTDEVVIADLVRKEIRSYRQLPQLLYQIQTKWRDDPHPRAGLIGVREFTMKDSYSLDKDWEGLDMQYEAHLQAYQNIFRRCALPTMAVRSDQGIMGGNYAHEFMYLSPVGEDTLLFCDNCGYSANKQFARIKKQPVIDDSAKSIEKVATPNSKTIEDLANYLAVPTHKTAKAVFVVASIIKGKEKREQFVIAIVRGDMEVNEVKLANAINATEIRPALESEIRAVGAIPGYASPVGLIDVFTIVDELIPISANLVAGANSEGYHLINVNYDRDYKANIIADITLAHEGDACIDCGHPLGSVRGVEVGKISKLGMQFSESMGCYFLDKESQSHPVIMGYYGIGTGRLLACVAEEHHDDYGLIWPITVAPYPIHLISLPWKNGRGGNLEPDISESLYQNLASEQIECLYDDREESPGVKFNDADLIGNPIRLTISERSLKNGGAEYKRRDSPEKKIIPYENIIPVMREEIKLLEQVIIKVPNDNQCS